MLKALLVDDEKMVVQAMSQLIEWERLGIKLMGMAENGQRALEYISENPIDIVITDIKMPLVDGLTLIEHCYKENKKIKFIVLSGYGEFEYAQQAMKYGVRHYLLKPCDVDEIQKVLSEVKKSIKNERLSNLQGKQLENVKEEDCIARVKLCVERYLSNPELSLKWIAQNHVYMNSDYLGKQFLKESGEKFSVYLNKKRVERAKELISVWEYDKVCEIAEHVGLGHNPQYFSQVFKKYTGYLLSDYKRETQKKDKENEHRGDSEVG